MINVKQKNKKTIMKNKKTIQDNDIIDNELNGSFERSLTEVEEAIFKSEATNIQKLATYIYLLCDSNDVQYKKTIDLLTTIEKFKNKLDKNDRNNNNINKEDI